MRTFFLAGAFLSFAVLTVSTVRAQDPAADAANAAMQANQQAMQQAQQQMQQAQEESQRASDAFMQQMMQANADAANSLNARSVYVTKPAFSLKPGTYSSPQQVRINDNTRDAVIYYTTDGWTPTAKSIRYRGPITVDTTMKLQAVAIVPGAYPGRSLIASAQYTMASPNSPAAAPAAPASVTAAPQTTASAPVAANAAPIGQSPVPVSAEEVAARDASGGYVLLQGTRVHLVFAKAVNSKTAEVGDRIALTVDQEIKSGDEVAVPKGTQGYATVTHVNHTGPGGAPGDIALKVESMVVNGTTVELHGHDVMEGDAKPPNATALIPVVGALTIFRHGKDAEIKAGMPVTAYVYADTLVPPLKK
jgi:hypothetical protein